MIQRTTDNAQPTLKINRPTRGLWRPQLAVGSRRFADRTRLHEEFLRTAQRFADRPAFVTDEKAWTYSALAAEVTQFAKVIKQRARFEQEIFGLRVENSADYIIGFYGILAAGGVALPLPVEQTPAWVDQVCAMTDCRNIVTYGLDIDEHENHAAVVPHQMTPEQHASLAAVFFTSGSSGTPKGVMLSHRNFLANAASIAQSLPLETTDRALAVLPFCHAYGNSVLQSHLLSGAALVVAGSTVFPEALVEAMQRHEITSFAGVPDLYRLLCRGSRLSAATVPTLRYATVAGGALRGDLIQEVARRIEPAEFYVMYGQTEATARLSCLAASELRRHLGSLGRGIPGVELQVVDAGGKRVPMGETGELRASGENVMLGYWGDPEATSRVLHDGWLYTGDLAMVDDEGFIYSQGRNSQLLKVGGYRVHPAEIEAVISAAVPSLDPIVVPFETPDGFTRMAMYLVPVSDGPTPSVDEIRLLCRQQLARHQRPDMISIIDAPPRTPSLKVDRQELARQATAAARELVQRQRATQPSSN